MIVQILERLYLGSLQDVRQTCELIRRSIKAIITCDQRPLENDFNDSFMCKHYPLVDMNTEDLFCMLMDIIANIEKFRVTESCNVIVHCNAGQSRSAAVVIGYVMWKLTMGFEECLQFVKKLKPDVQPNEGFVEQLQLFEEMEFKIDRQHPNFKRYQLERIGRMISSGRDKTQVFEMMSDFCTSGEDSSRQILYKCKKCRKPLFSEVNKLVHQKGSGSASFRQPWVKSNSPSPEKCTDSLFIEPVKWMQEFPLHELQGKVDCLKCGAKLGSWSWTGEKCHCGQWVTPAFHMDSKKIDKCVPRVLLGS